MEHPRPPVPGGYWVIASLAVVWMLVGLMALAMDAMLDEAAIAALPEGQRVLHAARPGWLFGVYAVAIFSGLGGAVGLLLRRAWAVHLLLLSLVAVTVQFGYTFVVMDAIAHLGAAAALPFPLMIFAIGVLLLGFALYARHQRWLT